MDEEKARNVINFYILATTLKDVIVEDCKYRGNLDHERDLSVAEQCFGSMFLAVALASQLNNEKINFDRVLTMLVLSKLNQIPLAVDENTNIVEHALGNLAKKAEYLALIKEFNKGETIDAKFANECNRLNYNIQHNLNYNARGILNEIIEGLDETALSFYLVVVPRLRTLLRAGWTENWKIDRNRIESVAEHIFGTCILALAIASEFYPDINIEYIIKMLSIHELEEVIIGDNTIFGGPDAEVKLSLGHTAAKGILRGLNKEAEYFAIIDEFDTKSSPNAQFAFFCDKLEFELQGKIYCDEKVFIPINKLDGRLIYDKRVVETRRSLCAVNPTYANVPFYINAELCKEKLMGTKLNGEPFLSVLEAIKTVDTTKIRKPSVSLEKTM
ncbi:MAG: HD domain-containing protein [Bacilli bacterium]|jgi:putative hydrolase of HD superfamily